VLDDLVHGEGVVHRVDLAQESFGRDAGLGHDPVADEFQHACRFKQRASERLGVCSDDDDFSGVIRVAAAVVTKGLGDAHDGRPPIGSGPVVQQQTIIRGGKGQEIADKELMGEKLVVVLQRGFRTQFVGFLFHGFHGCGYGQGGAIGVESHGKVEFRMLDQLGIEVGVVQGRQQGLDIAGQLLRVVIFQFFLLTDIRI